MTSRQKTETHVKDDTRRETRHETPPASALEQVMKRDLAAWREAQAAIDRARTRR